MFKKLLKYDFKSIFTVWWVGAVSILALAIPTGFCVRSLITANYTPIMELFYSLWIQIYYLLINSFNLFGFVLIFIRYYKNFFTDEGYLTFTLPVKRSTLFLSKVTSGVLINILSGATIFLAACIILLIAPTEKGSFTPLIVDVFSNISEIFTDVFASSGLWLVLDIILVAIILILASVSSIIMTYLFITIGATIVKKHKLITTIGLMYGSSFVCSMFIIPAFILGIMFFASIDVVSTVYYSALFNPFLSLIFFLIVAVFLTIISLVSFIITGTLERKLNLQ